MGDDLRNETVTKSGILLKQGLGWLYKPWVHRYFQLFGRLAVLTYEDPSDHSLKGKLLLQNFGANICPSEAPDGKDFPFVVRVKKIDAAGVASEEQKLLTLVAKSHQERLDWVNAINVSISNFYRQLKISPIKMKIHEHGQISSEQMQKTLEGNDILARISGNGLVSKLFVRSVKELFGCIDLLLCNKSSGQGFVILVDDIIKSLFQERIGALNISLQYISHEMVFLLINPELDKMATILQEATCFFRVLTKPGFFSLIYHGKDAMKRLYLLDSSLRSSFDVLLHLLGPHISGYSFQVVAGNTSLGNFRVDVKSVIDKNGGLEAVLHSKLLLQTISEYFECHTAIFQREIEMKLDAIQIISKSIHSPLHGIKSISSLITHREFKKFWNSSLPKVYKEKKQVFLHLLSDYLKNDAAVERFVSLVGEFSALLSIFDTNGESYVEIHHIVQLTRQSNYNSTIIEAIEEAIAASRAEQPGHYHRFVVPNHHYLSIFKCKSRALNQCTSLFIEECIRSELPKALLSSVHNIIVVSGQPKVGKTTLTTFACQEISNKTSIFWFDLRGVLDKSDVSIKSSLFPAIISNLCSQLGLSGRSNEENICCFLQIIESLPENSVVIFDHFEWNSHSESLLRMLKPFAHIKIVIVLSDSKDLVSLEKFCPLLSFTIPPLSSENAKHLILKLMEMKEITPTHEDVAQISEISSFSPGKIIDLIFFPLSFIRSLYSTKTDSISASSDQDVRTAWRRRMISMLTSDQISLSSCLYYLFLAGLKFDKSLAWSMCKIKFQYDAERWYAAWRGLLSSGWICRCSSEYFVISPSSLFQYEIFSSLFHLSESDVTDSRSWVSDSKDAYLNYWSSFITVFNTTLLESCYPLKVDEMLVCFGSVRSHVIHFFSYLISFAALIPATDLSGEYLPSYSAKNHGLELELVKSIALAQKISGNFLYVSVLHESIGNISSEHFVPISTLNNVQSLIQAIKNLVFIGSCIEEEDKLINYIHKYELQRIQLDEIHYNLLFSDKSASFSDLAEIISTIFDIQGDIRICINNNFEALHKYKSLLDEISLSLAEAYTLQVKKCLFCLSQNQELPVEREAIKKNIQSALTTFRDCGKVHREVAASLAYSSLLIHSSELDEAQLIIASAQVKSVEFFQTEVNPDFADTLSQLAEIQISMGDFEAAKTLLLRLLQIRRMQSNNGRSSLIEPLTQLAVILFRSEHFEEAKSFLDEALDIAISIFGDDDRTTAFIKLDLGNVLFSLHQFEESKALYNEALATIQAHLGEDCKEYHNALYCFAKQLYVEGKIEAAKSAFEKVLRFREKTLGHDAMETLKAREEFEKACSVSEKVKMKRQSILFSNLGKAVSSRTFQATPASIAINSVARRPSLFASALSYISLKQISSQSISEDPKL